MFDQPIDALLYRDLEVRQLGRQVELAIQQLRAGDFRAADARKMKGRGCTVPSSTTGTGSSSSSASTRVDGCC